MDKGEGKSREWIRERGRVGVDKGEGKSREWIRGRGEE